MGRLRKKLSSILFILSLFFIMFLKSNFVAATLPLEGVHGIILIAYGFDNSELLSTNNFMEQYGADVDIVGPTATVSNDLGASVDTDFLIDEFTNFSDYDFLYIPGGNSPSNLVEMPNALAFVVDAYNEGLCLAAMCYGPWVLAAADIISGRNISGNIGIESHITDAGANYIPTGIVIDGPFVTADVPYFDVFPMQGLLKGIGLFESEPPEVVNCTVELLAIGEFGSVSFAVEVSDYFDPETVIAHLYKFDTEQQQYVFSQQFLLFSNPENTIYSKTVELSDYGNYSLWIEAEDVLGNNAMYENAYQFINEDPNSAGLGLTQFSFLLLMVVSLITLVITGKRKR
ncbi:MAG: DJ-1/PfpI family protein [Candidatus Heimdallarchaeota archaeon]|nr:DJ-1/PfpI family protein [Candidatus Heimdallarchaeota archaeon]